MIRRINNFLEQKILKFIGNKVLKREFKSQIINPNERVIEYEFVFKELIRIMPKKILDVGSGTTSLPSLISSCGFDVTAIDNIIDYWKNVDCYNKHFYIKKDDITNTELKEKFDVITCISTLEHIWNYINAIKNMSRLLNPKGSIILTFPYDKETYVQNIYSFSNCNLKNMPFICQIFNEKCIKYMIEKTGLVIFRREYWQCFDGGMWQIGKRLKKPVYKTYWEKFDLLCLVLRKLEYFGGPILL